MYIVQVQVHTTNVNSWKAKTLDSSHFFLKGPCYVGIECSIDRLIEAIWRKTKFQSKSAQLVSVNLTWTNSRTCRQSLIPFVPLSFRRGDAQHRNSRVRTTYQRLSYWVNEGHCAQRHVLLSSNCFRNETSDAGRWNILRVPVVKGGQNMPLPPVELGLTDQRNIGGPPGPPGSGITGDYFHLCKMCLSYWLHWPMGENP